MIAQLMFLFLSFFLSFAQETTTAADEPTTEVTPLSDSVASTNATNATNGTTTAGSLDDTSLRVVSIIIVSFMVLAGAALFTYDRKRIAKERE